MVGLRRYWNTFRNFMIVFSFVLNFIFLVTLFVVLSLLFDIKSGIAQPLVNGLYSSFVGLNNAKIITNINVKDQINVKDIVPVKLDIPLKADTTVVLTGDVQQNLPVVLTEPVNLNANAAFTLPGGGGSIRGSVAITLPKDLVLPVSITLPKGLKLPVALDMNVPVRDSLPIDLKVPVNLNVPVNIDLKDTQLNDVAYSLREVVAPFAKMLNNLPDNWLDLWPLIGQVFSGKGPDLLKDNDFTRNPWPGYRTGPGSTLPTFTPTPGGSATTSNSFSQPSSPTPVPTQSAGGAPANPTVQGVQVIDPTQVPQTPQLPKPTETGGSTTGGQGGTGGQPSGPQPTPTLFIPTISPTPKK